MLEHAFLLLFLTIIVSLALFRKISESHHSPGGAGPAQAMAVLSM